MEGKMNKWVMDANDVLTHINTPDEGLMKIFKRYDMEKLPSMLDVLTEKSGTVNIFTFPFVMIATAIKYKKFKKRLRDLPQNYPEYFV
jgi:hypothetical protein